MLFKEQCTFAPETCKKSTEIINNKINNNQEYYPKKAEYYPIQFPFKPAVNERNFKCSSTLDSYLKEDIY